MKTKEQALDWISSQEWYGEFIKNARNEHDWRLSEFFHWLSNQVCVANIIIDAFNWSSQDEGFAFWNDANREFLHWFNSADEQPSEDEQTEQSSDRWVFDRGGSKEAPFYMVYAEGKTAPTFKHGSMEEATKEADRLAKLLNTKTYVLAAVMEIIPEIVTSAVGIDDMEHQVDNPF